MNLSIWIASISLGLSIVVAWFSVLRPAEIIKGAFPFIELKRTYKGESSRLLFFPNFVLKNVGARPTVLINIRLKINLPGDKPCYAYPLLPSDTLYKGFDEKFKRFLGGVLEAHEELTGQYLFEVNDSKAQQLLEKIDDKKAHIALEIDISGGGKWEEITNGFFRAHIPADLKSDEHHEMTVYTYYLYAESFSEIFSL